MDERDSLCLVDGRLGNLDGEATQGVDGLILRVEVRESVVRVKR